jgi:hypothetical protein
MATTLATARVHHRIDQCGQVLVVWPRKHDTGRAIPVAGVLFADNGPVSAKWLALALLVRTSAAIAAIEVVGDGISDQRRGPGGQAKLPPLGSCALCGQARRQRMHQMVRTVCNTTAGHSTGPASCTASAL